MKIVVYARYSSDSQRDESIDAQLRACREWATANNHTITGEYIDRAKSAKTDARPEFLRLMTDAELHGFQGVLVHKLNRFSRNISDHEFYKRHLKKHGVTIMSVTERIDESPEGVLMSSVMQGLSEYYIRDLAREVWKGFKENALKAKWNGGTPPLGYDVTPDGALVINNKEAAIVRKVFQRRAAGRSLFSICKELNAAGFRTKRGQPFGKNSLHDLMRNERYIGWYVYAKRGRNNAGKRNGHKVSERVIKIENATPAIIDFPTWEKVQSMYHVRIRSDVKEVYLLRGLIRCGTCGGAMTGTRRINKGAGQYLYYYRCGTANRSGQCKAPVVRRELVEGAVINTIRDNLLSPAARDAMLQSIAEAMAQFGDVDKSQLGALAAEQTEKKKLMDQLLDIAGKTGPVDDLVDKIKATDARLKEIKGIVAHLTGNYKPPTKKQLQTYLDQFTSALLVYDKDPEKFRPVISEFIEGVDVFPDKIVIAVSLYPLMVPSNRHQHNVKLFQKAFVFLRKKDPAFHRGETLVPVPALA